MEKRGKREGGSLLRHAAAASRFRRKQRDFCPFKSELLQLSFFQAQQFHAGLHGAVKALSKDSELVKFAKATHSKEVKTLKAKVAKLSASSTAGWEKAKKLTEELKSARVDVLAEFKESEDFHEEAMAYADIHARTMVDKWLKGEVGKQFLLDLATPDDDQGAEDITLNASADTTGSEIPMDSAYLNSSANLNSVAKGTRSPLKRKTHQLLFN
nr:hypothetical protein Iba_chr04bCG15040 [Ipomoea batatas]